MYIKAFCSVLSIYYNKEKQTVLYNLHRAWVSSLRSRPLRASPTAQITPAFFKRHQLSGLPGSFSALAQCFQVLGLEDPFPAAVACRLDHPALRVGQVGPREEGPYQGDRAKEQEDETLARVALVRLVDAKHDEHGYDAAEFAGGGRDAVTSAAIARRENLGGNNECKCIGACFG